MRQSLPVHVTPCTKYSIYVLTITDYSVIVSIGWAHLSEMRAPHLPHFELANCEFDLFVSCEFAGEVRRGVPQNEPKLTTNN